MDKAKAELKKAKAEKAADKTKKKGKGKKVTIQEKCTTQGN